MRCCTSVMVWLSVCVGAVLGADESSSLAIAADLKSRGLSVSRATVKSAGGGLAIDVQRDVVYAVYGDRKLTADVFVPRGDSKRLRPAVLVVHGGGWMKGDKAKFHYLAAGLARRGYVSVAVGYRLGGEAKFPAAVHDCNAATRWLRSMAGRFGVDPGRIGAVGGSAGGHLVGLMAAAPQVAALQGDGGHAGVSSALQAAVVLAGPMQLTTGSVAVKSREQPESSFANKWFGKTLAEAPQLYRLGAPFTHFSPKTPPILFLRGQYDALSANVEARSRLAGHGVTSAALVYYRGRHGCWNQHPWFDVMVDEIDSFLAQHLGDPTPGQLIDWSGSWLRQPGVEVQRGEDRVELVVGAEVTDRVLKLPRLNNPVRSVEMLGSGPGTSKPTKLKIAPKPTHWEVRLPVLEPKSSRRIRIITVGRPWSSRLPRVVTPLNSASQSIVLAAHDAIVVGKNLRYEPQPHKNTVGYWNRVEDWCWWSVYIERPGRYEVRVMQGCGTGHGGSRVSVGLAGQRIEFTVEDTGGFQAFRTRSIGEVTISRSGLYRLEIRPISKKSVAVMDVRQVQLVWRAGR
ncbi:MAG: alpha/beta hydrolase [Planctomycetaceae bacterium]